MALQNFVLLCVYPRYAPWDLENWANRVALCDAALARWSNVGTIRVQSSHAAKDENGC